MKTVLAIRCKLPSRIASGFDSRSAEPRVNQPPRERRMITFHFLQQIRCFSENIWEIPAVPAILISGQVWTPRWLVHGTPGFFSYSPTESGNPRRRAPLNATPMLHLYPGKRSIVSRRKGNSFRFLIALAVLIVSGGFALSQAPPRDKQIEDLQCAQQETRRAQEDRRRGAGQARLSGRRSQPGLGQGARLAVNRPSIHGRADHRDLGL